MLEARKPSIWKSRYEISSGGRLLAEWVPATWRTGGSFTLAGRNYEVRSNVWATKFQLTTEDGVLVATAQGPSSKRWTIQSDGVTHQFQRVSFFRQEQALMVNGHQTGLIKRTKTWHADATADLPGMPQLAAVFAFVVVLTTWDAASAGE